VLLLALAGWIVWEAVERFSEPRQIDARTMAGIALIGLVGNAVGLLLLHRRGGSLNLRGAYLHVLGDTLSSVGVIVAAGVILLTGFTLIDPILSIAISCVIVWSAWRLIRESVDVLLEAVPAHLDLAEVLHAMEEIPGVAETVDMRHIKGHYYESHRAINPTGIVPKGPQLDFDAPHDRGRFAAAR